MKLMMNITSGMVSMRILRGTDRPDIVSVSNDKFEVYIR